MTTGMDDEVADELHEEYEFSSLEGGVRGKHFKRARAGTNLVLFDPDVARAFPTPEAVSRTLRLLAELAEITSK